MSDDKKFGKGEGEDAINPLNPQKGDLKSDASETVNEGDEDTAKDLGDKAKEKFEEAKETADDFAEKAKKTANEFTEEAKQTFDNSGPDSGKMVAIIAHITAIGWIVALIMNSQNKTEFGSYYIRQTLGIWLLTIVLGLIPIIGCFAALIGLVLIVMSLINAANDKMVPTVGLGHYFQDWFKGL